MKKHLCEEKNEREIPLALYIRLEYSLNKQTIQELSCSICCSSLTQLSMTLNTGIAKIDGSFRFKLISKSKLYSANKCLNANDCWHFNIYEQDKFYAQLS